MSKEEREKMRDRLMILVTKPCMFCGGSDEIVVLTDQYEAYANGAFVQDAFPDMPASRREQILTGTHGECWDKAFKEEE